MKKIQNVVLALMLLLTVITSVFSPVWCFESDGEVSLEWTASCVPDRDCFDCFDLQASALDHAVNQTVFVALAVPVLPVQKLETLHFQPLSNGISPQDFNLLIQPQFLGKDSVVLLI